MTQGRPIARPCSSVTRAPLGSAAAALVGVALAASSSSAAPLLVQTYGASWPTAAHALEITPIEPYGPISIEPNADPNKNYIVVFEFDEPILAAKGVSASNATVIQLVVLPNQPFVLVELAPVDNETYVTINVEKVAAASGVYPDLRADIGFLRGDYNADGVVDPLDLVAQADSTDGLHNFDLGQNGPIPDFIGQRSSLPNQAPVFIGEAETMHVAPGAFGLPQTIVVRDDRLAEDDLTLIASSTNPTILPSENIQLIGSGPVRSVVLQAPAGVSGACTAQIFAVDDAGFGMLQIPVVIKVDEAPDARFKIDHYVGVAPLQVNFDASDTSDILQNVAGYNWDFGDGANATGERVTHTFTQPGEYEVELVATDANGLTSTETRTVTVASGATSDGGVVTEEEARRFLWQAAFGPTEADIATVMAVGYETWIDLQIGTPATIMDFADIEAGVNLGYNDYFPGWTFDDVAVEAPDQLRQRMAWALIQIIVLNHLQDESSDEAALVYYEKYVNNALGNYRDLLDDVTYSYPMAAYLTYRFSSKADPITGSVPDENYAREIQQLFSIGLWGLEPDGTRSVDIFGDEIPNYDNDDIREFAKIFTGLRWNGSDLVPLTVAPFSHDLEEKYLHDYPGAVPAGGIVTAKFPSSANVHTDVANGIDNVFNHPSCAPFIAEMLIKRMTSSNPTPAYVERVAEALSGTGPYGSGLRGDLAATAKAILLDPEVRDPEYRSNPYVGKAIEPQILHYGLYRVLDRVDRPTESFPHRINANVYQPFFAMRQGFMLAPSVFNFYNFDFTPIGSDLDRGGLTAPELWIHDDLTAIETPNIWMFEVIGPEIPSIRSPYYDQWIAENAAAPDFEAAIVDAVADHMLSAPLSTEARDIIVQAVRDMDGNIDKVQAAVSLIALSPEFTVLK